MLVKWQPFSSLLSDTLFEDFFPVRTVTFEPKIDVRETEKQFIINAELPGLNKEDFKLTTENDNLILEGEKKFEHEEKEDNYYRSERRYGSFRRVFRLTDTVDRKNINAEYKNGVLTITLNKTEKAQAKEIEVKVS